jgi:hypothetical protein
MVSSEAERRAAGLAGEPEEAVEEARRARARALGLADVGVGEGEGAAAGRDRARLVQAVVAIGLAGLRREVPVGVVAVRVIRRLRLRDTPTESVSDSKHDEREHDDGWED